MESRYKILIITLLLSVFAPLSVSFAFDGPLQVKNQFPLFLHACPPYLEKASLEDSFSLTLSHSSTYLVQRSERWTVNLDMEITEVTLRYRKIMGNSLELGLNIPVIIFSSGFMDGFLEVYHKTFGFPDYGRSKRPLNSFLYEVRRDGILVVKGENQTGLGDIRLSIKKSLILSDRFNFSIKGIVELPTGNAERGYGNGSMDAGFSILFDKAISENIISYWNFGIVFPGRLKGYTTVDLRNFVYGALSVEYLANKHLGLIAQLEGHSSIYPETGISAIDGTVFLLSLGGRYYSGNSSFEVSLTEDLNTTGAPDFILNLSYKIKFH
ncbi:MAG: DUF3187 family protein [Nitrospirae bacterium]|nr:DUF3187 family protein [Nitrospirota bacterium]